MTFQAIDTLRRIIPSQPSSIDSTLHIWESAVLLPLIEGPKGWEILFEVRSSALTWQPGDICFPGGHREDMDRNLSDTALRETSEELGIPQNEITLLGPLDYFYGVMGPLIYPYVGILPKDCPLTIEQDEVAELFTIPVETLLSLTPKKGKMAIGSKRLEGFPPELETPEKEDWVMQHSYDIYFYRYKERLIWGITARILTQFLERLRKSR